MIEKVDYAVGAGALSSPWWIQLIADYGQPYAIGAGCILVTIRIASAVREWWRGRKV